MAREPLERVAGIPRRNDDRSGFLQRQLIGYSGAVLPIVLVLLSALRPTQDLPAWRVLDSISAYYYTGATAAFVGVLVALALFLIGYRGYDNEHGWADRAAARLAALAAFGVAFFPTRAPEYVDAPAWWAPAMQTIHLGSAAVLFSMFAVFSIWLFRKKAKGETADRDKIWRNRIYLACGLTIVGCMTWIVFNQGRGPIFWPESIALGAFALSWLVKGYALRTIVGAARWVWTQ